MAAADFGGEKAVPFHVDSPLDAQRDWRIEDWIAFGKMLFEAKFTVEDGAGRPFSTSSAVPGSRPAPAEKSFVRTGGPDANSCLDCHNSPVSGGAGGFVANVFIAPQDVEFDFESIGAELSMERGTTALQGAGLLETLAVEMTRDLHRSRDEALEKAYSAGRAAEVRLETKGVDFGRLVARPDGTLDVSGVEGVHPDLIVRPFSQKAVSTSLREFTVTSLNVHFGMQATERFGARWTGGDDFDGDGHPDEIKGGDVTALTLFQATLPPPILQTYEDPQARRFRDEGRALFGRIGCETCHVPELPLESTFFAEPNPYNPAGNLRVAEDSRRMKVDLAKMPGFSRLKRDKKGRWLVPAFTDLKRHLIADRRKRHFANEIITQKFVPRERFRTAPLWGVGSTAPYGHRGDLTTLREAILHHGGAAAESSDAFAALAEEDRRRVIFFLQSLVIASPFR